MAIVSNKNTTGQPMVSTGRTGTQSIKFYPGPRVYVKTPDPLLSTPSYYGKSNGVTPTGWTDLGTVDGDLKVTYDQKIKEIRTGMDNYLRGAYLEQRGASFECSLAQMDDIVLETISGVTASVIVPGSTVNYALGSTDMQILAVLFVIQNKDNGKEIQFYNPQAYVSFMIEKSSDSLAIKMTSLLPSFTPAGALSEQFLSTTLYA